MTPERLRGITAMLMAVAVFAAMDAILKVFAGHYPTMQVGAMRGAASLPFILLPVLATGRWRDLRPVRWWLHLFRGLLSVVILGGFVHAVRALSLADAYSIFFVAPLLVTALSVPILGEHVDWRRWLAIGFGLCGVLVMLRPSAGLFATLAALGALASASAYAASAVTVRLMHSSETTVGLVFSQMLLLAILAGLFALPAWVSLQPQHWPWLAALGATGALGQHFITQAFRYAPASVVAPFEYTALLWGVAIDWLFWAVLPSARMFLGATLVVASGIYLIWRERQLHVELAAVTESPRNPAP
jgi:drug/metabolite transporter (DMT)-like permease